MTADPVGFAAPNGARDRYRLVRFRLRRRNRRVPPTSLSTVETVEGLVAVKAASDYYDDVHYRRLRAQTTTLCGLSVRGDPVTREASCLRCREFAAGDF